MERDRISKIPKSQKKKLLHKHDKLICMSLSGSSKFQFVMFLKHPCHSNFSNTVIKTKELTKGVRDKTVDMLKAGRGERAISKKLGAEVTSVDPIIR